MKKVEWTGPLPNCDVCKKPKCGVFNTPTKVLGPCGGRWANMCGPCFDDYGIVSSVTEKRTFLPEPPFEVKAIAKRWGGENSVPRLVREGVWRFAETMENYSGAPGFIYEVHAPGVPMATFEDSGQPCGDVTLDEWTVRALNDAPDSWWSITREGEYRGYSAANQVWQPNEATL